MTVSHLFLKCTGTVVLFGVTVFFGIIPIKFMRPSKASGKRDAQGKRSKKKIFIGLCNCFAGGVFFSTCLLDLLPLVRDKITSALHEVDIYTRFPLGEFIASFGFLLMLVTELIVHSIGKDSWLVQHSHSHHDSHEDLESDPLIHQKTENGYGARRTDGPESKKLIAFQNQTKSGNTNREEDPGEISRPVSPDLDEGILVVNNGNPNPRLRRTKSLRSLASVNVVVHSSLRIYILILALSLHSLFEGLSVGLVTDVNTLIQILIALLIHKSILSFALGVKLVDGELATKTVVKGIILFAAMAPIGMGLGLAVLSTFSPVVSLFFSGILQGIATGSFLYVTFFEILPEEFNIAHAHKGPKVLSVILGFIIIAGMCYYENRFHHIKKIIPKKTKP